MSRLRQRIAKMIRPRVGSDGRTTYHAITSVRKRGRRWWRYVLDPNRCSHRELRFWWQYRKQQAAKARLCRHRWHINSSFCLKCQLSMAEVASYADMGIH